MTENSAPATSKTPAIVAMWIGYALGALGFFLGASKSNAIDALEPVVLWSVGALGVASFVRHAVLHRSDAARMGWDLGRRNNFQIEVGMANLAWGLVAFGAVAWDWGVTAQAAVALVFAVYLVQAFVLHLASIGDRSEQRSSRAAWGAALATLAMAGGIAYFAIAALDQAGIKPFN
jgi:hypothetical protein